MKWNGEAWTVSLPHSKHSEDCVKKKEEKCKRKQIVQREGMRDAAVYKCVVGIVSLSH